MERRGIDRVLVWPLFLEVMRAIDYCHALTSLGLLVQRGFILGRCQ
jgi:hypothetical protein